MHHCYGIWELSRICVLWASTSEMEPSFSLTSSVSVLLNWAISSNLSLEWGPVLLEGNILWIFLSFLKAQTSKTLFHFALICNLKPLRIVPNFATVLDPQPWVLLRECSSLWGVSNYGFFFFFHFCIFLVTLLVPFHFVTSATPVLILCSFYSPWGIESHVMLRHSRDSASPDGADDINGLKKNCPVSLV